MAVRQDSWVCRSLARHAFVIYACNHCGEHYFSQIAFAVHLVEKHAVDDPTLVRFVRDDSGLVVLSRPNRSTSRRNRPSASL